VLGVVPYLHDLGLPQEDSVSFKAGLFDSRRPEDDHVDIALVDLPHISNFTDVEPLLAEPDVYLRIVRNVDELGRPDSVILPGSKNVIGDLAYLNSSGLGSAIINCASNGCEVVGICGGFQMLGTTLADPHGLEGERGSLVKCLQLLQLETELAREKTLTRKEGVHLSSGQPVYGYEIHHGTSRGQGDEVLSFADGSTCGFAAGNGNIWGAYLHGIFDSDPFRRWFINRLRQNKGLAPFTGQSAQYDLEPALDRLAEVLRESIDMSKIYQLLHL
jgi:adenosylcobyric acid synthase